MSPQRPQVAMTTRSAPARNGAFGTLARYGASRLVAHLLDPSFPGVTWTVNLRGCFLIGMTRPLFGRLSGAEQARYFLVVGFLGSFVTFSTYSGHGASLGLRPKSPRARQRRWRV